MISIVVVSHSAALARAALDLTSGMVPDAQQPRVVLAAGMPDGGHGTDATAVAEALRSADGPDGTLVLMDLGSALLSAEVAVHLAAADLSGPVCLSAAPLVEGLVSALVAGAGGASLPEADRLARAALASKQDHLAVTSDQRPGDAPDEAGDDAERSADATWRTVLDLPHGLHARPAAALCVLLAGFDVDAEVGVAGTGRRASGDSTMEVQALDARQGDELVVWLDGPDATRAAAALDQLAARGFDDARRPRGSVPAAGDHPVVHLDVTAPVPAYVPDGLGEESDALEEAVTDADDFLADLVAMAEQEALVRGDSTAPAILGAVRAVLHDPALAKGFARALDHGANASQAAHETFEASAATFAAMASPYLRERAGDLRALDRLVQRCLVHVDPTLDDLPEGHLLAVAELDALTAAQVDPETCPGILVADPSELGHGVLVARARGLAVHVGAAR